VAPFAEEMMVPLADLVALETIEDKDERLAALDAFLVDTAEALSALPQLRITEDQAHRLRMGNSIIVRGRDAPVAEPEAVALSGSKLIAIGEIASGEFHPRRVFN
jgi:tRNA pseudouridine55 synthase